VAADVAVLELDACTALFVALFAVTMRRGGTDPVITVDRSKALTAVHNGETLYFCSAPCRKQFQTDRAP
jgi:YHS domain-containing protein